MSTMPVVSFALRLSVCIACLTLPASAQDPSAAFPDQPPVAPLLEAAKLPKPGTLRLDNGMDVLVISNSEIPWVSVSWRLLAGGNHDPEDKTGLANITAAMLPEGTEHYSSDAMAEKLDLNAISLSGSAGHDSTVVNASALSDKVGLAVELLAEAIRRPNFPAKDFNRIRRQMVQGMSVSEQDGGYQADRTLARWVYGEHFRARPAEGTSASVARIERDDLAAFHKSRYMPNGSTLIFSGDITAERAGELARRFFGDWPAGQMPAAAPGPLAPDETTRIVIVDRPKTEQVQIRIGQRGFERTHPDYMISRLFNQVFGGSFVSRLNRRVRVQEGYTYGARGGYEAAADCGDLTVSTFTRPEAVGQTVKALLDEIRGMHSKPPTPEELEDGKGAVIGQFGLSMETPQQVAGKIWHLKFHGLPFDYYDDFMRQIKTASAEQVQKFATEHVKPDQLKIVVVGRSDEIQPQLEPIAPVTVIRPGSPVPPPPDPKDPPT